MTRTTKYGLLPLVGASVALSISWLVASFWFPGRAFDTAEWESRSQRLDSRAAEMAERLIAREVLIGKTHAEVVTLLGGSLQTHYFGSWDMIYLLGPERGMIAIDSEWLVVRFSRGKVAEARLVTD